MCNYFERYAVFLMPSGRKAEPEKRENLSHYKRSTVSLPYGESMTDIPPYYDPNSTELTVITNVRNEYSTLTKRRKRRCSCVTTMTTSP